MHHFMAEMLKKFKILNFKIYRTAPSPDTSPREGDTPFPYSTSFGASILHLLMLSRPTFHFSPTPIESPETKN